MLKQLIRHMRHMFSLRVPQPRSRGLQELRPPRETLVGVLGQVLQAGLSPRTIIDVGAAYGQFSRICYSIFPKASYVLVEPLEEYKPYLEAVKADQPHTQVIYGAATKEPGEVIIHVHPDLVGSSLYLEDEDSDVNGYPREVRAVKLDQLMVTYGLKPPYLLKIDVQGAELDVLMGASQMLMETEYVILETSFFQFFQGGPQFHEVVKFMKEYDFVVYDLFGPMYRPLDDALSQMDVSFVKDNGKFRNHHFYATRAQREAHNRLLRPKAGQKKE